MLELMERLLQSMKVELAQSQKERVLKEFYAKRRPSVEGKGLIMTVDRSLTLINPSYGEPYHSISAGALTEVLKKFIEPSGLESLALEKDVIRILDVGFGLGYNSAVAIYTVKSANPKAKVEVLSFEKELPQSIPLLPPPFTEVHKRLLEGIPSFESDGISFRLLLGDARKSIREVEGFCADVVLHDGFSPMRNPELWTYEFLREVKGLMRLGGVWISYTSSLPVRRALELLGFGLSSTSSVGRKRGGTKGVLGGEHGLSWEEMEKLKSSPHAIPFEDPELSSEGEEILMRYLIKVECLKCKGP